MRDLEKLKTEKTNNKLKTPIRQQADDAKYIVQNFIDDMALSNC